MRHPTTPAMPMALCILQKFCDPMLFISAPCQLIRRDCPPNACRPCGPVIHLHKNHRPPELMTTRAPSLPSTPGSLGFGLRALPPFLLKKPSMPVVFCPPMFPTPFTPSTGSVAFLSARSDQGPVSSNVTCIPPPFEALRVPPRGRWFRDGCSLVSLWLEIEILDFGRSGVEKYSEFEEGKSGTGGPRER